MLYAITGDGFSMREIEHYGKAIRKELLKIDGVAKVNLDGVIKEVIYLEIPRARLASMGLSALVFTKPLQRRMRWLPVHLWLAVSACALPLAVRWILFPRLKHC